MTNLKNNISLVANFLFPSICAFCNINSNREIDLCTTCEQDLPFLKNYCLYCAQPLPEKQIVCGHCLKNRPPITRIFSLFHYQTPIDQLIVGLKFNNRLVNAKILGTLFANYLHGYYQKHDTKPEIIIPVPLHPNRLYERGYNQALELARPIAAMLQIPINHQLIKRIKNTQAQSLLSAKKRGQNINQAFTIIKNLKHEYVAIVDDVITTGSTIVELCKTLRQQNVKKIDVWCCAKAHFSRYLD